jgi:hypothetical protein
MGISRETIDRWFDCGIEKKAKWMIVVCDTFDYGDYPVYATTDEDFWRKYDEHNNRNMQTIMETYDLGRDKKTQLDEWRAWNRPVGHRIR